MARFLVLWQPNWAVTWPADPSEGLKLTEMMFATIDNLMKKGEIEEFGFFPDGRAGYLIIKGEASDIYRRVSLFQPYILCEAHEIIPYEKGKEITIELSKAQIEASKM